MADPIVHITAGIPDLGTGNITTLGLTIPPAGTSTSSVQGGPMAQGAVTTAAPTYTNGQVDPLSLTTTGLLRVDGSGVTQPISGTITATISGTPTVAQGSPPWTVKPDGTAWAMTSTSANVNVTNTVPVSGTVTANQGGAPWSENITQFGGVALSTGVGASGTGIPRVTVANDSNILATQSGTWTVQPGNTANTTAWLVTGTGGTFPVTGTVTANQGSPPWTVGGDTASGVADANNPVKIGGVARTSNPTAVSNGNRVNAIFDKLGKQVVVGAIRDVKGVAKQSLANTTETTIIAAVASTFNDVYAIVCTNKSAVNLFVDFRDSLAGITRMTLAVPANDTRGFTVSVDSAMVQAAVNTAWTATLSTTPTSASVEITMLYVGNL
jgi:hypothetical protein